MPEAAGERVRNMQVQKSFEASEGGRLYLVATPIGNLQDVTLRALETLRQVDWIACEDTRRTRKLLSHYDIHTPLISYHEHNRHKQGSRIMSWLKEGRQVALVSDAGTPLLSDPGEALVREAIEAGIPVVSIPGANAAINALIVSGLPAKRFTFLGFLPRQEQRLRDELRRFRGAPETLVLYEAPHRLARFITIALEELGNRRVVLVRELTKKHEEVIRGTLAEIVDRLSELDIRGEFTVLLEGKSDADMAGSSEMEEASFWSAWDVPEHVAWYERQGMTRMEAMKRVAKDRNMSKRDVYRLLHHVKQ